MRLKRGHHPPAPLEFFPGPANLSSCRFTNLVAKNAGRTVKFSCAPVIGKGRNVRIAARRDCRKNSLCSPPPETALRPTPPAPAIPALVACAAPEGRIRTDPTPANPASAWSPSPGIRRAARLRWPVALVLIAWRQICGRQNNCDGVAGLQGVLPLRFNHQHLLVR